MSTMSAPHDIAGLSEQHVKRWRRLHDERRFRVEQIAALEAEHPSGRRRESVNRELRLAAATTLREIDAALKRMDEGRYGRCVTCSQTMPAERLDAVPTAALCMPCHYKEQTLLVAAGRIS